MWVKEYAQKNEEQLIQMLKELTLIPAPSHHEEARAERCCKWLTNLGAKNVYIDESKNMIFPMRESRSGKWVIFSAHMDTVFDFSVPLEMHQEGERLYCPGVGDDTANLTVMLFGIKYLLENGIKASNDGLMFVGTACEECGSLGTRNLVDTIGPENIRMFYSFDATYHSIYTDVVNRITYRVTVKGPGGHPLGAYGKPNAIEELAKLIVAISTQCRKLISEVKLGRSAFNIDTIQGGTGNNIAKDAVVQMQFRSTEKEYCQQMEGFLLDYISHHEQQDVHFCAEQYGDAPLWSKVDRKLMRKLGEEHLAILQKMGITSRLSAATTDCRYPLSKGVPSLCLGLCEAFGPHTMNEYMLPHSLVSGLEYLLRIFHLNKVV